MSNVIVLGGPPILKVMEDAVYAHWRKQGWHPNPERYYPLNAKYDFSNPKSFEPLLEQMRLDAIGIAYTRLKTVYPDKSKEVRVSVCFEPGGSPSTTVLLTFVDATRRVTTYT